MSELSQKLARLYARTAAGIKYDLRYVEFAAERLGHPERSYPSVHVAGTNGKGSVCAIMDSVLRAAGCRTGLYTSPHLLRFNERIQVSGQPISDGALIALFDRIEDVDREAEKVVGRRGTFFEITTLMAFEYFRQAGVQVAIVETGMGGRLDATNILKPVLTVITRIALEHCDFLGHTVAEIAREKAGIIKPGTPVVVGTLGEEAADVIGQVATDNRAALIAASELVSVRRLSQDLDGQRIKISTPTMEYPIVKLPLLGRFQLENLSVAIAATECLAQAVGLPLEESVVRQGLESVRWPARCQVLCTTPLTVLDVAHNPDATKALAEVLKELGDKKWVLVFGLLADKDARGFAKALGQLVRRCWVVPLPSTRSAPTEVLVSVARELGWEPHAASVEEALWAAFRCAREQNENVCIAGSLYLAGEVLRLSEEANVPWKGKK